MTDNPISLRFVGRDADQHTVDMRLLGRSLQGFDRIISDGIILLSEKRLPRRGERSPLKVKALPSKEGSHEVLAILQDSYGLLPLGWHLFTSTEGQIVWRWTSFVLSYLGGRKNDAEEHLQVMLDLNKQHLDSREASDAAWRDMILQLVGRLLPAANNAVAPIGPSTRRLGVRVGTSATTGVDEAMADTIRTGGELDLSDLHEVILHTDGFSHSAGTLRVKNPDAPERYISAVVKDPVFDHVPNVYTSAANEGASIIAMVKMARREGNIERIYIMEFIRRLNQHD